MNKIPRQPDERPRPLWWWLLRAASVRARVSLGAWRSPWRWIAPVLVGIAVSLLLPELVEASFRAWNRVALRVYASTGIDLPINNGLPLIETVRCEGPDGWRGGEGQPNDRPPLVRTVQRAALDRALVGQDGENFGWGPSVDCDENLYRSAFREQYQIYVLSITYQATSSWCSRASRFGRVGRSRSGRSTTTRAWPRHSPTASRGVLPSSRPRY